jgi:hypothetical protein
MKFRFHLAVDSGMSRLDHFVGEVRSIANRPDGRGIKWKQIEVNEINCSRELLFLFNV